MMDMYSLYQFAYSSSKSEALLFSKILTLELSPNKFLSNFYLDRFFIINGDSIKLFDNKFLLVKSKSLNHNSSLINFNSKLSRLDANNSNFNLITDSNVFYTIKDFTLLHNQISNFKSTLEAPSYNLNPNFSLKNINNVFNKSRQTSSNINNPLFSNLALAKNKTESNNNNNNNKFKIYEKGCFMGNPNLIMLSNKETVSLCDFRVLIFL